MEEPLRTTFCSSDLVRLLGAWVPAPPDDAALDFAERLSLKLGPLDAIALQAVNQQGRARRAVPRKTPATLATRLREDVERVRQALAHAIAQEPEPFFEVPLPGGKTRAAPPSAADAIGAGYQRRHLALQRQMEQMVSAVRDHVRQALAGASPRLQQLAAVDATLEQVLAARDEAALPKIPRLLEQRFRQRRLEHERAAAKAEGDADPARWQQPGGWLHAFAAEWRQALLAERDLRLHPVTGLVEAVAEETNP
ncbi:MAG: DUF3348 family protein [Ramlibacter sp.]